MQYSLQRQREICHTNNDDDDDDDDDDRSRSQYNLRTGVHKKELISYCQIDDLTAGVGVSYNPLSHSRHNGEV